MPPGKKLKELFSDDHSFGEFKEPAQISGKLRWQVIQVVVDERVPSRSPSSKERHEVDVHVNAAERPLSVVSEESRNVHSKGEGEKMSENERVLELVYKLGVYLEPEKTLKDLRNAFIDSKQLNKQNLYFQFLRGDSPGDVIAIDTEEETELSSLGARRTVYIEAISKGESAKHVW